MKILVTGSNGFIGKYLCNRLKEEYDVIGLGTNENSKVQGIEYLQAFIENPSFVSQIKEKLKSCDVVVHLAALIDKDNFNDNLIDVNCKGTIHVLQLARELNVEKIIHASSLPLIGKPITLPITEEHEINPETLYHITKSMSEQIINLGSKYNIKTINLRIPSPIGIGMNGKTILPVMLKNCLSNKPIAIYGKGERRQNYIDARDVSEVIVNSIKNDFEGTYNIASEKNISNIELAKLCIKLTNSSSEIVFNGKVDLEDDFCWDISLKKVKEVMPFYLKYSLEETIKDLINEFEKGKNS